MRKYLTIQEETDDSSGGKAGIVKNRIYRKIKDNSGMSLIAALLYFAFCTIIGTVLLAVAGTAAGRISQVDTGAEERYQLVSAANLLSEKMGARTFRTARTLSKTYVVDETEDPQNEDFTGGDEPYPERGGDPLNISGTAITEKLSELADNMAREVVDEKWGNGDGQLFHGWEDTLADSVTPANRSWDKGDTGTEPVKYQVVCMTPKKNGSASIDGVESVYARVEMDENLGITAYLYTVEGATETERNALAKEEEAYRKSPMYLIVRIPAKNINVKYEQIVKIEKAEPEEDDGEEDDGEEEDEPELYSVRVTRKVGLSEIGWKDAVITVINPKDAEDGD